MEKLTLRLSLIAVTILLGANSTAFSTTPPLDKTFYKEICDKVQAVAKDCKEQHRHELHGRPLAGWTIENEELDSALNKLCKDVETTASWCPGW